LSSINVRKVVWAAQELGLDFERTDAGAAYGITQTPAYLAKNPNALVPLLQVDGDESYGGRGGGAFTLWESNTIVRYLCARYSLGALYPDNLRRRFDAERWMDWQQTTFNGAGREAFIQLVRTAPELRDGAKVAASVGATEPLLALLNAHLGQHRFMGGEHFCMADIPLGCEMHRWWGQSDGALAALGVRRQALTQWPHLQRWWADVQQRPGAAGVLDQPLA
jgi:glutathione S-transferase